MPVAFARWSLGLFAGLVVVCGLWMAIAWTSLSPVTGCSAGTRWIVDLYARKAEIVARQPPSILVVGGSATHFGISAEEMREHHLDVVNFGTHAGLGLPFLLDHALRVARPGDTLLLMLEYDHYEYAGGTDAALFEYAVCTGGDTLSRLPLKEVARRLLSASPKQVLINFFFNDDGNRRYQVGTLNSVGDETANTRASRRVSDMPIIRSRGVIEIPRTPSPQATAEIERFLAGAKARGIGVAVMWPGVFRDAMPAGAEVADLTAFWDRHGVPLVGCFADSYLDPEEMYDTVYHANAEGARRRARNLVPYVAALQAHRLQSARCDSAHSAAADAAERPAGPAGER